MKGNKKTDKRLIGKLQPIELSDKDDIRIGEKYTYKGKLVAVLNEFQFNGKDFVEIEGTVIEDNKEVKKTAIVPLGMFIRSIYG